MPAVIKWGAAFAAAQWYAVATTTRSALIGLVTLMFLDYATGLVSAYVNKTLDSSAGFRGLARKGLTLTLILSCHIIEGLAQYELHLEMVGAVAFCVNELISIVENCGKAGVELPDKFVDALIAVKTLIKPASKDKLQALYDGRPYYERPLSGPAEATAASKVAEEATKNE